MTIAATATPTQDERVMAALAHASIVLPFTGILAPILIWVTQKDKSPFVAFNALQAVLYHFCLIIGWFLAMACYMCSFLGGFLAIPAASATNSPAMGVAAGATFAVPFLVFGCMFVGFLVFVGYGLTGAFLTFQGRRFKYVILGDYVERSFSQAHPEAAEAPGP